MPIDWTPFVELVRRRQRFLLATHVRPDPDGLGSQLAMAEVLGNLGKDARMIIASNWPPRYDFLDPEKHIRRFAPPGEEYRDVEAVIILDTGTWQQLGDFGPFLRTMSCDKVVIDHHLSQDDLGAVRFVDTTAEATARLVYEALEALGQPLTPTIANCLLAALATDTGWFRHRNTTSATHRLAATLMDAGADPTWLFEEIYERETLPRKKLKARVNERIRVELGGKAALSFVRNSDYAETGAIPQDTEDLINEVRSIAGVQVAVLLMEQPAGGVKVSFRSRGPDIGTLAEQFGGGGHKLAAGATLNTSLEEAERRVLAAVKAAVS